MSDFGEEIIARMDNKNLLNPDNPMRTILLNTIGEWLQRYDDAEFYEQLFLATAERDYLDLHGVMYGVYRKPEEDDDTYRNRIVYESISHLTSNYVNDVFNLNVYVDTEGMEEGEVNILNPMILTSDNPCINSADGYFILLDNENDNRRAALNKKMVIGGNLKWAIL